MRAARTALAWALLPIFFPLRHQRLKRSDRGRPSARFRRFGLDRPATMFTEVPSCRRPRSTHAGRCRRARASSNSASSTRSQARALWLRTRPGPLRASRRRHYGGDALSSARTLVDGGLGEDSPAGIDRRADPKILRSHAQRPGRARADERLPPGVVSRLPRPGPKVKSAGPGRAWLAGLPQPAPVVPAPFGAGNQTIGTWPRRREKNRTLALHPCVKPATDIIPMNPPRLPLSSACSPRQP